MAEESEGMDNTPATNAGITRVRARDLTAVFDRLSRVLEWLAAGMSPRAVTSLAQKPPPVGLGLSRTTADRYVGAALHRLQADASAEPIESKRARSIAFWHGQIERALNHRHHYVQNGEEQSYPAPDLKAANQARAMLDIIEGLTQK